MTWQTNKWLLHAGLGGFSQEYLVCSSLSSSFLQLRCLLNSGLWQKNSCVTYHRVWQIMSGFQATRKKPKQRTIVKQSIVDGSYYRSENIVRLAEYVFRVSSSCDFQLERTDVYFTAQCPEVRLLHTVDAINLHHFVETRRQNVVEFLRLSLHQHGE